MYYAQKAILCEETFSGRHKNHKATRWHEHESKNFHFKPETCEERSSKTVLLIENGSSSLGFARILKLLHISILKHRSKDTKSLTKPSQNKNAFKTSVCDALDELPAFPEISETNLQLPPWATLKQVGGQSVASLGGRKSGRHPYVCPRSKQFHQQRRLQTVPNPGQVKLDQKGGYIWNTFLCTWRIATAWGRYSQI